MSQRLRAEVTLTESQRLVRRSIRAICEEYDHEYWRERSENEEYPHEFVDTLAEEGWMGALIPDAYGGADLGTEEVVVMMEEIAAEGGIRRSAVLSFNSERIPSFRPTGGRPKGGRESRALSRGPTQSASEER